MKHNNRTSEALVLAQHAADLIEQQSGALDAAKENDKMPWRPNRVLDAVIRGARGYHEMDGREDAFVHETKGNIHNVWKVADPEKRAWDMARYPIVAPYHKIALQGAHRIVGGPNTGGVHRFQFSGDAVSGSATYRALRTNASPQAFTLQGADAWRHGIIHLQDIPGLLNLEDPERAGARELAHISPAATVVSFDEYLRRHQPGELDQPEGQLPAPAVDPQQAALFPYMSPLPPDEQWGWGDRRHGGLGGH